MIEHPEQAAIDRREQQSEEARRAVVRCETCANWHMQTCINEQSPYFKVHTHPADRCDDGILIGIKNTSFYDIMESGQ
jgi:hypothetical protein